MNAISYFDLLAASHPDSEMTLSPSVPREWQHDVVEYLSEVEDQLDLLEACGFTEFTVESRGESKFEISWR